MEYPTYKKNQYLPLNYFCAWSFDLPEKSDFALYIFRYFGGVIRSEQIEVVVLSENMEYIFDNERLYNRQYLYDKDKRNKTTLSIVRLNQKRMLEERRMLKKGGGGGGGRAGRGSGADNPKTVEIYTRNLLSMD